MNEKSTLLNRKSNHIYATYSQDLQETKLIEQRRTEVCIQHSQPVQYLCFSCSHFLLCAQCITTSNHQQHELKNLQKSRQFFRRELQEWNSRLELKSEILDGLNEQLRNIKAEIFEQAQSYKQKVVLEFDEIIKLIKEQLQLILKSITDFANECKKDYTDITNHIVNKRMEIKAIIEENESKINEKSIQIQAQYYHNKIQTLDLHILEKQISYYKQLIKDPVWGIEPKLFRDVENSISKLRVTFQHQDLFKKSEEVEKVRESLAKSTKKSKKQLKLNDLERRDSKARNSNTNSISPFLVTFTPKNLSKQKGIPSKKSPGERTLIKKKKKSASKMISLPASPSKEDQKEAQVSPSVSNKNIFKKK